VEYSIVTHALIAWYKACGRVLPWRQTHDPYAVWVSEVMLQQTQVTTVLPYYARFLQQFPTVQALAAAPLAAVLKQWEGLGYYTRGRNLHKAAQQIVSEHNGVFPGEFEAVMALPGVGRSTAGAILTFAFSPVDKSKAHPILDGNVKRVLARLFCIDGTGPALEKALWPLAQALVDAAEDVYSLNQALMELGATHCKRSDPHCLLCPLKAHCQAYATSQTGIYPHKVKRPPTPHYAIAGAVIWKNNQVYIQQRPESGLLGGLWEFPGGKQEADETLEQTAVREVQEETGMTIKLGNAFTPIDHAYTHFKITLHMFNATWLSGDANTNQPFVWVNPAQLNDYAFPKANGVIVKALMASST
jgi:A/G-specific adenine glycosylase